MAAKGSNGCVSPHRIHRVLRSKRAVQGLNANCDSPGTRLENVRRLKEFEKEIARGLSILPDRESMAILHNWAVEKGNSAVAHLARAKELSIERMESTGFDRALLVVWGATANYGLAPLRPLLWMIGAMLTFSCLVSLTGVTVSPDITLSGWRLILTDQATFLDRFTVGLVTAAESITSPLSIFSFRRLLIVEQWWVAVIQVFYSYFCLAMIFWFGFSVRRRFRVS
ncbi:hypothetical protein, partial [Salibaculum sp.]|uniref:hypothetical protein n=1 Tax=Salibaculum sp. TaxID=2855480 RepID=UPI002B47FF3E